MMLVMEGATVISQFDVIDFDAWRATYSAHAQERGATAITLYRDVDAPTRVFAIIEWEDARKAKAYIGDAQMTGRLMEAGVVGVPEFTFVRRA